jgi:hypothetical protein
MQEEGIQVQNWWKTSAPDFISAIVVNFILSLSLSTMTSASTSIQPPKTVSLCHQLTLNL